MRCAEQSGSGGLGSLHALESIGPSHHIMCYHPKCSLKCIFIDSYWGFTKQAFWLNHWPLVPVLDLSALSSPQSCKKFTPVATPSMMLVTTSMTERFSGPLPWLVSTPMKDSKFQQFQEVWDMNQVRIKYANKIVVHTGQGKGQIWIINNTQKGTWERPGHFLNTVSALVPVLNLHRPVFYTPCNTFIPGLSDYFSW